MPFGYVLHESFVWRKMIVNFQKGDLLELKKAHPCGNTLFVVLYLGSDVKIRCMNCDREMLIPRVKLEKSIKKVIPGENND